MCESFMSVIKVYRCRSQIQCR